MDFERAEQLAWSSARKCDGQKRISHSTFYARNERRESQVDKQYYTGLFLELLKLISFTFSLLLFKCCLTFSAHNSSLRNK